MYLFNPRTLKVTRQFVEKIVSLYGDILESIILFGSWAKGTQSPESDVDLLIVMADRDPEVMEQIYEEVLDILLNHQVDISLKIYSKGQFQHWMNLGTPFMAEVSKTGVKLWSKK